MSVPLASLTKLSVKDYLELELATPFRHEYVAGELFAMSASSLRHNTIALNLAMLFREHLRGTPCRVFMSDVKLNVAVAEAYFYPDVMVSCEPAPNSHYVQQPKLVLEVLSDSTADYDQNAKREMIQRLDSVQEYVLVSQTLMDVRVYRREAAGWTMDIYTDGMRIPFHSLELEVAIERVYDAVWE